MDTHSDPYAAGTAQPWFMRPSGRLPEDVIELAPLAEDTEDPETEDTEKDPRRPGPGA